MAGKFDIFKKKKNGEFIWIETLEDCEAAKTRMWQAALRLPGKYIVFDRQRVTVIAASIPRDDATCKSVIDQRSGAA